MRSSLRARRRCGGSGLSAYEGLAGYRAGAARSAQESHVRDRRQKPRGLPYSRATVPCSVNTVSCRSRVRRRQTAMLVVENLPAIERWLAKLPDGRRMELNRPITVWRGFLAATKGSKQSDKWRDRKPMPAEDFNKVPAAVAEALPSGEVITIAIAVIRAQGFAVPRDVSCGRELVLLHA